MIELCKPEIGMYYGCLYLAKHAKKYGYDLLKIIASYNAGSVRYIDGHLVNKDYVDKVMNHYKRFRV
jgi:soluble lytic murein transglycosylase-like protein